MEVDQMSVKELDQGKRMMWAGSYEYQVPMLYNLCVESRQKTAQARVGSIPKRCPEGELRRNTVAKCQTVDPNNLCAQTEARDGMMQDH